MKKPLLTVTACAVAVAAVCRAQEPAGSDPVALVRSYFAAGDPAARAAIGRRIASHPAYRPSRLSEWLHRGAPFAEFPSGFQVMTVDVGAGVTRRVHLVVPEGYRPDRPYPLVYALHPSGQPAEVWAREMQNILGRRARQFLIASPEYEQNYLAAGPPFVAEHAAILDAVARRVHVDADRVYPFGYSKGGFAAWFVALYYPDRVAGAISMAAGFDVTPADDGFWKLLVANVAHTPVLNTWGENDPMKMPGLDGKPVATFGESNRRFQREVQGMGLPIVNLEVPGGVHNNLIPPAAPIVRVLETVRQHDPGRLSHTFRHLHQSSCFWLEGLGWVGDSWGDSREPVPPADGETASAAIARKLEPLLGRLTGEVDGQTIRVTRRHVSEMVVWIGERTIDWKRAVTLEADGKVAFRGALAPDAGVALARALETMDFDMLRFAGIRLDASGKASPVTVESMPKPAWRSGG